MILFFNVFLSLLFLIPLFLTINFIFYSQKIKRRLKKLEKVYTPNVSIIVPFRQFDYNLPTSLRALASQKYKGNYEILFVSSEQDTEVVRFIKDGIKNLENAKFIQAVETNKYRSDKVNNLMTGINHLREDCEVIVVMDSDIVPHSTWLSDLVQPLQLSNCGASSGSSWITAREEDFLCFATRYWDFLATIQMCYKTTSFIRGFSMAFKKSVFDKLNIMDVWNNAFHDNLTLTTKLKQAGYKLYFSPHCLVNHCFNIEGREWIKWVRRQSINTKVNYPNLWRWGMLFMILPRVIGASGFLVTLALSFLGVYHTCFIPFLIWPFLHLINATGLIFTLYKEHGNMKHLLDEKIKVIFYSFGSVLLGLGSLGSLFSNKISWRGRTYKQESPYTTVTIDHGNH